MDDRRQTTDDGRRTTFNAQTFKRSTRSGQAVIFVGLLIGCGVLIGLVAVAVDGGSALLQRRNMQNGADSAALGAAMSLGASVVLSGSVGVYSVTNGNVTARVEQALVGNRGGVTAPPVYSATVEYGTYGGAGFAGYSYTTAATYYDGSWTYSAGYVSSTLVPATTDAVRVTASIDNPTTFAMVIGIPSIRVQAISAAALNNVPDYNAEGPTWPMTRCEIEAFDPEYGICHPFLFWSSNLNDPTCRTRGNFKNLVQLGAWQGASYEGRHEQLLTEPDTRSTMTEVTGNNNPCGRSEWYGQWSPAGNCTDPITGPPPYGDVCCSSSESVANIDIANYIRNEFHGRISLNSTWRAEYFRPNYTPPPGDWLEVYNGGDLGNNISDHIYQYVREKGVLDGFTGYGKHVDKVMYFYDRTETWKPTCPSGCDPQWLETDPQDQPNRVHMSQALRFRFYEVMAQPGGFETPANVCGAPVRYNTNRSEIYGVFSGSVVDTPPCANPPCGGGHGLNNYVGFIDP